MIDFKNYSHILLAIGTFLYLGLILRGNDLESTQVIILLSGIYILVISAFSFRYISNNFKKKLENLDDEHNQLH